MVVTRTGPYGAACLILYCLLSLLYQASAFAQIEVTHNAFLRLEQDTRLNEPIEISVIVPAYDASMLPPLGQLLVSFVGPHGQSSTREGFFYGRNSAGASIFKARYAPTELGSWTYAAQLTLPNQPIFSATGTFAALPGDEFSRGPLRIDSANPLLLVSKDANGFDKYASIIGMNDEYSVDPGGRSGSGASVSSGPFYGSLGIKDYLGGVAALGAIGEVVNRMRHKADFNNTFCAELNNSGNDCDTIISDRAVQLDDRMRTVRLSGMQILYGIFGNRYQDNELGTSLTNEQKFLMRYTVARWGEIVSIWQLCNEKDPPASWTLDAISNLTSLDQRQLLVGENWGLLSSLQTHNPPHYFSPHYYNQEYATESDQKMLALATSAKQWGKPVLATEDGNKGAADASQSSVNDYAYQLVSTGKGSTRRIRIRSWAAIFNELFLFHFHRGLSTAANMGWSVGVLERQQLQILRRFMDYLGKDPDTQTLSVSNSQPTSIRSYGLVTPNSVGLYLQHFSTHNSQVSGAQVTFPITKSMSGFWIDPATGSKLTANINLSAGTNTLTVPAFQVDLAFIARSTPLSVEPLALYTIDNSQWSSASSDLDGDGIAEYGPDEPPHGKAPLTLTLNGAASLDWDGGTISSYNWDFGDGSSANGAQATHTYSSKGVYNVTFRVTDDEGQSAKQSFTVRAMADANPNQNDAPTFNKLGTPSNISVFVGQTVLLLPKATDYEQNGSTYTSETVTLSASQLPPGSSFAMGPYLKIPTTGTTEMQFMFTPDASQVGTHSVVFKASDPHGAFSTLTVNIHVLALSPDNGQQNATLTSNGGSFYAGQTLGITIDTNEPNAHYLLLATNTGHDVGTVLPNGISIDLNQSGALMRIYKSNKFAGTLNSQGNKTLNIIIPADAALIGQTFSFQAYAVKADGSVILTNVLDIDIVGTSSASKGGPSIASKKLTKLISQLGRDCKIGRVKKACAKLKNLKLFKARGLLLR